MKKSVISTMFNESHSMAERILPDSDEYKKAGNDKEYVEAELCSTLSNEQRELFEEFMEKLNALMSIEEEEAFRLGVSFGIRVTAESSLYGERENT